MSMTSDNSETKTPWAPTPWSAWTPAVQWFFEVVWFVLCRWTPKPFNFWRLLILRIFGCQLRGSPFVHARARLTHPWKITLHDRACLGDRAVVYALGPITIAARTTIAQEAYLCAGTHDLKDPALPLICAPIVIGERVFIGARAFILPGVTIADDAIVGAAAVVTRNVDAGSTVAGNPARVIA